MLTVLLGWINAHYKMEYEPIMGVMVLVDLLVLVMFFAWISS